jgi:environmental stress-induced protein Ves
MRTVDPKAYRTMPWKNGGGSTTEALLQPQGASLEDFELRVSMARVETSGPFSCFFGVDRTLVVTSGESLVLETADGATTHLDAASAPFSFTGEDPVTATLVGGPVSDFTVMTRRSRFRHRVGRVTLDGARTLACTATLSLLYVVEGTVTASDGKDSVTLERGAIILLEPGDGQVDVTPVARDRDGESGPGRAPRLILVDFFRR